MLSERPRRGKGRIPSRPPQCLSLSAPSLSVCPTLPPSLSSMLSVGFKTGVSLLPRPFHGGRVNCRVALSAWAVLGAGPIKTSPDRTRRQRPCAGKDTGSLDLKRLEAAGLRTPLDRARSCGFNFVSPLAPWKSLPAQRLMHFQRKFVNYIGKHSQLEWIVRAPVMAPRGCPGSAGGGGRAHGLQGSARFILVAGGPQLSGPG